MCEGRLGDAPGLLRVDDALEGFHGACKHATPRRGGRYRAGESVERGHAVEGDAAEEELLGRGRPVLADEGAGREGLVAFIGAAADLNGLEDGEDDLSGHVWY